MKNHPSLVCPSGPSIDRLLKNALAEDVGPGDITTLATIPPGTQVPQLAAWTAVARVLMNLDEMLMKR